MSSWWGTVRRVRVRGAVSERVITTDVGVVTSKVRGMTAAPTRRKRKLGLYLRELRAAAERSPEDAAAELGRARPTITRAENGQTLLGRSDVRILIGYYGATDEQRATALALWEQASQDTTRVTVHGAASPQLRAFLRAEAEARAERAVSPLVVYGLLQTREYARAVHDVPSGYLLPEDERARSVETRMSRQRLIEGPDPLVLHVVMDEAALRRMIGGTKVMRDQLAHLLDVGERPNVTLQVLPFAVGAHGMMAGGATIVDFPDPEDPPAVHVECVGGGAWVEDEDDVKKYVRTFDAVAAAALTPAETANLITNQLTTMRDHD